MACLANCCFSLCTKRGETAALQIADCMPMHALSGLQNSFCRHHGRRFIRITLYERAQSCCHPWANQVRFYCEAPKAMRAHAASPPIPKLPLAWNASPARVCQFAAFRFSRRACVANFKHFSWCHPNLSSTRPEGYRIARSGLGIEALGAIDSFSAREILK